MIPLLPLVFLISMLGLAFAAYFAWDVLRKDTGTPAMRNVSDAIREGAEAFIKRQYKTIGILAIVVAVLIFAIYMYEGNPEYAIKTGIAFLFGALCSAIAGIVGMWISV